MSGIIKTGGSPEFDDSSSVDKSGDSDTPASRLGFGGDIKPAQPGQLNNGSVTRASQHQLQSTGGAAEALPASRRKHKHKHRSKDDSVADRAAALAKRALPTSISSYPPGSPTSSTSSSATSKRKHKHKSGHRKEADKGGAAVSSAATSSAPVDTKAGTMASDRAWLDNKLADHKNKQAILKVFDEVRNRQQGVDPSWVQKKRAAPHSSVQLMRLAIGTPSEVLVDKSGSKSEPRSGTAYLDDPDMRRIFSHNMQDGVVSEAAGIPDSKGGLSSVVDILIDGTCFANFHGSLTHDPGGLRSVVAGNHGPTFVVFSDQGNNYEKLAKTGEVEVDGIEAILVQDEADQSTVHQALDKAVEYRFITQERCDTLKALVQTYREYADSKGMA